jgi:P4 family phage/plasmid primase-like protien
MIVEAQTMTFPVAFFRHKADKVPACETVSLDKLIAGLSTFKERAEKDGRLWSPTLYKDGTTRANENVEAISCLVLDMDGGFDPQDFLESWREWTYVVHSSYSSTPEHPKWRAVFPLSRLVPAEQWEEVWARLVQALSYGIADPARKDAAGMYFTPSHPPGGKANCFVYTNRGRLLDPNETAAAPTPEEMQVESYSTGIRPGDDYEAKSEWSEILEPHGWTKHRDNYRGQTLWTRPGKDRRQGCSAKTGPGPRGDRFYCWSSNAGVPERKALTKFALFAHLNHGGDFAAAADQLRSNGYGADVVPSVVSQIREGEHSRFNLTDLGNAERFIALHGQTVRYCHPWGRFLFWDGRRWEVDETGGTKAYELAYLMIRGMQKEAAASDDEDVRKSLGPWAHKCETRSRIENIVAMAKTFPSINVVPSQLDGHPDLLNLANGTFDLKEGALCLHRREDLITRLIDVPYSDATDCPAWGAFLHRVLGDDKGLLRFVYKALGYSLTGFSHEQVFFFLHGSQGNNGKSTFIETVLRIMGDYGRQTPTDTLMARKENGINNDIARLKEARFVAAPETEEGHRLNEGLVKRLTGGDTITARYLHQEFFEFKPQFKIWMSGNHKPNIRGVDDAIWRRVVPIPFQVVIPPEERNPELLEILWSERTGILGWMIEGCECWKKERLGRPETIKEAISTYREEMDVLGAFLEECTVTDVGGVIKASALYEQYAAWTKRTGEWTMPQKKFGQAMQARGERSRRAKTGNVYEGRTLLEGGETDHVYRGSSD